jgi:hypothetical protein
VDELVVECVHLSAGCTFTCQRQLLAAHLKDACQYTEVSCLEGECGQVVLRKDANNHSHKCVHRLQECDGCAVKVKAADMEVSHPNLLKGQRKAQNQHFFSDPSCSLPRKDGKLFGLLVGLPPSLFDSTHRHLPRPHRPLSTSYKRMPLDRPTPHPPIKSYPILPIRIHQRVLHRQQRQTVYPYRDERHPKSQGRRTGGFSTEHEARDASCQDGVGAMV